MKPQPKPATTRRALLAGAACGAVSTTFGCRSDARTTAPTVDSGPAAVVGPQPAPAPTHAAAGLGLRGVDVLDPRSGGAIEKAQTVWIKDGRIEAIVSAGAPAPGAGRLVLDLAGKTVIPGLFDMHGHLPDAEPDDAYSMAHYLAMQLAAGVTGVRSMRGTAHQLEVRDRLQAGELAGPTLWVGAPLGGVSAAEAEQSVRGFAADGYDFVKVLGGVDTEAYRKLAETARGEGLSLAGHVPTEVPLDEVLKAGQCIEHFQGLVSRDGPSADRRLLEEVAKSGCYNCPTMDFMAVWFQLRDLGALRKRQGVAWVGADQRAVWERWQQERSVTPEQRETGERLLSGAMATLALLNALGAPLLTSASHGPWIVPGFGLFEEFDLWREAGVSELDILRAATSNAAQWLGDSGRGQLAVGATADLVVLDASPLDDLAVVRTPHAVVSGGRWNLGDDLQVALKMAPHAEPAWKGLRSEARV